MELWIGLDAEQFAARASAFLTSTPEHNVLATVLEAARAGRYQEAIFAVASDADGQTVGVAMRTPPHQMLAAGVIEEPDAFIEGWLGLDPGLPGVSAEPGVAEPLARAWADATGGAGTGAERITVHAREALHRLDRVIAPERPAPGALRRADWRESAQMSEWGLAFGIEAGVTHPEAAGIAISYQIEQGRLYVWEAHGRCVSLIGHTIAVAGSVRIGPVYTPPELRGNGYATTATATLSQQLLDGGAQQCLLYTDLANPISNHIYATVGYVRIGDWVELTFLPEA